MKKEIKQGIVGGVVSLFFFFLTYYSFVVGQWLYGICYLIIFLFWYLF